MAACFAFFAHPRASPSRLQVKHVVIPSWYQRPGYVRAMADLIEAELQGGAFPAEARDGVEIFFSAHGVPVSYIEEGGLPAASPALLYAGWSMPLLVLWGGWGGAAGP
jgi:protoheme ferro-lyase